MDNNNLRAMQAMCPQQHSRKLSLFLKDAEVPDPYSGGPEGFERVLDLCQTRAAELVRHWKDVNAPITTEFS